MLIVQSKKESFMNILFLEEEIEEYIGEESISITEFLYYREKNRRIHLR